MIKENKKPKNPPSSSEVEDLRKKLEKFQPQTQFAATLWRLSRANLENATTILDADEIMSELGRSRYE